MSPDRLVHPLPGPLSRLPDGQPLLLGHPHDLARHTRVGHRHRDVRRRLDLGPRGNAEQ
ncbi:hypothetical protein [Actinokineospora cianjurensis]|uniref:hypothetical protein n=1 Tax=Actinokineospora cianjurensis TaxID=585224 RepID=UPI001476A6CF|nr:hypothetical protein [Actinokineospora cianjurensis]